MSETLKFNAVGRRKEATARVRLFKGSGGIEFNRYMRLHTVSKNKDLFNVRIFGFEGAGRLQKRTHRGNEKGRIGVGDNVLQHNGRRTEAHRNDRSPQFPKSHHGVDKLDPVPR